MPNSDQTIVEPEPASETGLAQYTALPFGCLDAERPEDLDAPRERFRIAILGDFSGRASRGTLAIGDDLARRRPIRFDVDRLDAVIAGFATTLTLPIGRDGAAVEVPLREIDDLHPDELYDNVALFEELDDLRQRVARGDSRALAELHGWAEEHGQPMPASRPRAKGSAVPADRRLSDFQALLGDSPAFAHDSDAAEALIARIVGPHVQAAPDPAQPAMLAAIDAALSDAMRAILHHPDFQAVEASWRALDFLARRVETGPKLEIVLYDVSAEEWAADLSAQEDLAESGLFRMLAEAPRLDAQQGPISAVFGLYTLEETPPHAALLARMGKIAAWMNAPFVTAISPRFLDTPKQDRHPLVAESWDALRALPEARNLGIAAPRFLLRAPYGRRTDPIEPFDFEEFSLREGLHGMLWANPAVLSATLLAASVAKSGKNMRLGEIMSLGDMPVHVMTDAHGDQVALPCTERLLTTCSMAEVVARGFMPLLSIKGRNEVRQGSFQALGGDMLAGPWALASGKAKGGHETSVGFGKPPAGAKPATASARDNSGASDDDPLAAFGEEDGLPDMGETAFPDFGEDDAAPEFDAGDLPDFDGDDAFADFGSSDMPDCDGDGDAALPDFDDSDLDDMLAAFGDDTPAEDDADIDPALAAMLEDL
ncbi:type VI secretion system contractile sheath large subunit [Salipiger bermudensis]|uniref:type VI secretion system contractile sheath domain-containing protein n=1 Tax=Salipiger bermudensis TaxID=344736 RepID=UPI001C990DCA|nr:type VI secretion system contractile sheath large subunit [Salipiger bermudensis]MBY6003060.1 type VI secretion system contractile sheath large subunit [Salipiger bermudensis]